MEKEFVEAKIATEFGPFNIRVYSDPNNKETVVLWTDNIEHHHPVLVRIHSECMTGDIIGSLHCDCGKQLDKSLRLIQKESGVLIYLKQEGRGIGLFEKIKAYQLQSEGYDTFEANVLLGHRPDERTYEMAKTALDDLNIKQIRLLTNNPSKVSELAKLGIEVVNRVPLIIKPNKYNKRYYDAKKTKFQHLFQPKSNYYFCQCQVENDIQVKELADFVKNRKTDPLLRICMGVSCNLNFLDQKEEIARIKSIFNTCKNSNHCIPILHFSFKSEENILKMAQQIKRTLPFVDRIQLNDCSSLTPLLLKQLLELFQVDIPLSDENFDLIKDKQFRDAIEKNHLFILIDNSKGKGIQEPTNRLKEKIDILLSFGLNNIALCGGFGPDDLSAYFDLRRHYRINLSIDAESKLKTNGRVDLEKTKLYLQQVIRFDDPNQEGIEQTRDFLKKHQRTTWSKTQIGKNKFMIHPNVFHAGHFPSTAWFAKEVADLVKDSESFCEVGCGSGIISCSVALVAPKIKILATDISPFASENTQVNAKRFNLAIETFTGDVLDKIPQEKSFDYIFWALPFGFLDPGTDVSSEELQVFDPGYRAIRKLFQDGQKFLKSEGKLLLGFSPDLGHSELLDELAKETHLKLETVTETNLQEKEPIRFQLLSGTYSRILC